MGAPSIKLCWRNGYNAGGIEKTYIKGMQQNMNIYETVYEMVPRRGTTPSLVEAEGPCPHVGLTTTIGP